MPLRFDTSVSTCNIESASAYSAADSCFGEHRVVPFQHFPKPPSSYEAYNGVPFCMPTYGAINFRETYISQLNFLSHAKIQKLKNIAIIGLDEYGGNFQFEKMTKDGFWKRDVRALVKAAENGLGQEWGTFKIDIWTSHIFLA